MNGPQMRLVNDVLTELLEELRSLEYLFNLCHFFD